MVFGLGRAEREDTSQIRVTYDIMDLPHDVIGVRFTHLLHVDIMGATSVRNHSNRVTPVMSHLEIHTGVMLCLRM